MRTEELDGRKILLMGKSRALSADEFAAQLKVHKMEMVKAFEEGVDLIVEGRMIDPIAQDELDALYERRAAPIITIDVIEQALCESIDGARLLMSLKLSGDRERLLGYLQNPYIDNSLFLRLLKLYDWEGEGFFESDVNRDVTAALIKRFYENIERNHNVQYANMGLMHLIAQSEDSELIETIALLSPLQEGLKNGCDNSTLKILTAIAEKGATPERVLKLFARAGNTRLKQLVALRSDISPALQRELLESADEDILEALAYNSALDREAALSMLQTHGETIAANIHLDETLFAEMIDGFAESLALNPSLNEAMQLALLDTTTRACQALASNELLVEAVQERLFVMDDEAIIDGLAANTATDPGLLAEIASGKQHDVALASNIKTPEALLQRLFETGKPEVLAELAQNRATPTELLYQLQVDQRYARYVMENPGFGEHIQKENIGWLV